MWRRVSLVRINFFGGTCLNHHQSEKNQWARDNAKSNWQLPVTANFFPSSLILFTLMVEATLFSETSAPTRATRIHISEDGILYWRRREILRSYTTMNNVRIVYWWSEPCSSEVLLCYSDLWDTQILSLWRNAIPDSAMNVCSVRFEPFYDGDYEEWSLLRCDAVWLL
jgi:hypothetical protein